MLLGAVPEDGSSIGNTTLREILGWTPGKYFRVRDLVVDNGKLEIGRGRGGSVYRTQRALPSTRNQLPSNPKSVLPILPLAEITLSDIAAAIKDAPTYGAFDFRDLVSNTIGAIHQIPLLFHRTTGVEYQLKQVEAYFGRSSGSQMMGFNLSQRLRAATARGHDWGMIFAQTSVKASLKYERHGIRLLDVLREMDGLCISNNSFHAVGRTGLTEPGFLYMTFRILDDEPDPARELTKDEIKKLVRDYRAEILREPSKASDDALAGFEAGLTTANDVNARGTYRPKLINYRR